MHIPTAKKIFNDYCSSIFTCDRNSNNLPDSREFPYPDISASKATGPDNIPAQFLKLFAADLSPCLFTLFSASVLSLHAD